MPTPEVFIFSCPPEVSTVRFPWQGSVYEFQSLPFGLSSAPCVFTKLLKPVLARSHHQGIRLIICLDDLLVTSMPFSGDL